MTEDSTADGIIGPTGDLEGRATSARRIDPTPITDTERALRAPGGRMPAEWESHDATWIAWPHHEPDWPGKLGPIPWVYGEIARVLPARARRDPLPRRERARGCGARARGARLPRRRPARRLSPARRPERPRVAARLRADVRARRARRRGDGELAVQRVGQVRELRARRARGRGDGAHPRPRAACAHAPGWTGSRRARGRRHRDQRRG